MGSMSSATATADPPDEPAQVSFGSNGLPVAPYTRLRVLAPAPNSGVLVLHRMLPPLRRTLATMGASSAGTWSLKRREPQVERRPFTGSRSFTPTGSPCRSERLSPRMTAASASLASLRERSASIATTALTALFTFSIRFRQLSSSSTGESFFSPISRRASTAGNSQGSDMCISSSNSLSVAWCGTVSPRRSKRV